MVESLPKTAVVVVGAGASAGASHLTSPVANDWRPPVVRQLFNWTNASADHFRNHSGADLIRGAFPELANGDEPDLESRLLELSRDPYYSRPFVDVPMFLRDLLLDCGRRCLPGGPETYATLVGRLLQTGHDVAFVSLNYDNMLEQAVWGFQRDRRNRGLDGYVSENPLVVKVHGSVDWFWFYPRHDQNPEKFLDTMAEWNRTNRRPEGQLLVYRSQHSVTAPEEHFLAVRDGRYVIVGGGGGSRNPAWAYPALTAPLAGKTRERIIAPRYHLEALQKLQHRNTKYAFIGTNGYDEHVLQMLGEHCSPAINLALVTQTTMSEAEAAATRIVDGMRTGQRDGELGARTSIWHEGFREWLRSPAFEKFLELPSPNESIRV